MLELKKLENTEEAINYYEQIKLIPMGDTTHAIILSRILSGQYEMMIGYTDGIFSGIVIYYIEGTYCFIVGSHSTANMIRQRKNFFNLLYKSGIKTIRTMTTLTSPAYGRLMGMKFLWSVYEHRVEEE